MFTSIILLGCPGSGKGTQAELLEKQLKIPKISASQLLHQACQGHTSTGQQIKSMMKQGQLVPDNIIIDLVSKRIQSPDCANGFILDGFPRTLGQAEALEQADLRINFVIHIQVQNEHIIERLTGRRVHPRSGRTYHLTFNPPKVPGQDDLTGEPLKQRKDDTEAIIRHRLDVYRQETQPLLQYYKDKSDEERAHPIHYVDIDGLGDAQAINNLIVENLLKNSSP